MKRDTIKINFFTKIYFSIFKIKMYSELAKEGMKKSFCYIRNLILIFAFIYATIITVSNKININNLRDYLYENLPDFTYENGELITEKKEKIVLDSDLIKANFGGQIIIDTILDYENLLNEYKDTKENTIILTNNKYILITANDNIKEYSYNEILQKYFKEDTTTVTKKDVIDIFNNVQYIYYFIICILSYLIANGLFILIYDLIISSVLYLYSKITKKQHKFGEIYSMSIYASTILAIGILPMVFTSSIVSYILQMILLIITLIYTICAVKFNTN